MSELVFLLEDDADIARLVRHQLETAGYRTRVFSSAATFVAEAQKQRPALCLLDIMVPDGNGLEVCQEIRRSASIASTPIVFLTAKTSEADKVLGLELGADDYISKPFSPRELVARTKAVLRRFERPLALTPVHAGDVQLDPASVTVTVRGQPVETTATEFRLLDYLARHAGRVFSRDQLLDAVWRDTTFVTPRSVDVYIRRLREKIERDPENPEYLRTVRGMGYRFEAPK
ncbi:MAG: winged helix-turn-helix domain-containing protein [Terriglobales bacterium]